jgi:hypothetical protein
MLKSAAAETRKAEMHPALKAFITINNYFHDFATTLLLASGLVMLAILRQYQKSGGDAAVGLVLDIHKRMRAVVTVSIVWISVSAIPRILTFTKYELFNAEEKKHMPELIVKHTLAFTFVVCGAVLWIYLNRRIKAVAAHAAEGAEY